MKRVKFEISLSQMPSPLEGCYVLSRTGRSPKHPDAIWHDGALYIRSSITLTEQADETNDFRRFENGELKAALKELIRTRLSLKEGQSVSSLEIRKMVKMLRGDGWDARTGSVRTTLYKLGYVTERKS